MKYLTLIFLSLILISNSCSKKEVSTFEILGANIFNKNNIHLSIYDDDNVAISDNGVDFYTSSNGGDSWTLRKNEVTHEGITRTFLTSPSEIYLGCTDLYKSIDTGVKIRNVGNETPNNGFIRFLHVFNETNFLLIDEYNKFFYSNDGGNTYTYPFDYHHTFFNCRVLNNKIFANGIIYINSKEENKFCIGSDFGHQWTFINVENPIVVFNMVTENLGYFISIKNEIFKTIDGGSSWNKITSESNLKFVDICFIEENIGYLLDDSGNVFYTMDGAQSWTKVFSTEGKQLTKMYLSKSNIFITGKDGLLLKKKGLKWEF
jgi:hypothetical protein